jgi:hypothetical protein
MPTENYLDPQLNVSFPVLRIQLAGGSSFTQEGRASSSHFQSALANDTYQAVYASTVFTVQGIPGVNSATLKISIQNKAAVDIINWDAQVYTHLFPGTPSNDGLTPSASSWSDSANNRPSPRCQQALLATVFWDGNKWATIACEDLNQPCGFSMEGRITPPLNHYYVDFRPGNLGTGNEFCQWPIKAGTTLSTSLTFRWFPNATSKPALITAAPNAYKTQSAKWPLIVNKTVWPDNGLIGSAFIAGGSANPTQAAITTTASAFTIPAAGATAPITINVSNSAIRVSSRMGLGPTMNNGKVQGSTFAITAVSGTSVTLKNDDLRNAAAGTVIAAGTNVYEDWSFNPRRWKGKSGELSNLKLINPATGNLFAQEGDYSGLQSFAQGYVSTMHFVTDVMMAKAGTGGNINKDYSGYNPSLVPAAGNKKAFSWVGAIVWDAYFGAEYPQPDPEYMGDPYGACTPGQPAYCPELIYTDANFPVASIQQAGNALGTLSDGTVVPGFRKGCGLRADYLVLSAQGYPSQRGYASVGDIEFGKPGNTTIPNPPDLTNHITNQCLKVKTAVGHGFTLFYNDSWGPFQTPPSAYSVEAQRAIMRYAKNGLGVDILMAPECKRDDMFSASCPFMNVASGFTQFSSEKVFPNVRLVWPGAVGTVRYQNTADISMFPPGDTRHNPTLYAAAVAALRQLYQSGDHLMAEASSGTPSALQQSASIVNQIALGLL